MSHATAMDQPILRLLPQDCGVTLDVACGWGIWGFKLRTHKQLTFLVGVDVWKPYLAMLQRMRIYDALIRCQAPFLPFKPHVFHVIICSELLEHLRTKDEGEQLIETLDCQSKGLIILTTPLHLPQHEAVDHNPFNVHKTEWSKSELETLGFSVQQLNSSVASPVLFFLDDLRRKIFPRLKRRPIFQIAHKHKRK